MSLFGDYLGHLPHQAFPTVILGDFNENLLLSTSSSVLLQFMSSIGFTQLVKAQTTDFGSLLDHIYYNQPCTRCVVDVVDIYFSDHDACFVSIPKNK